MSLFDWIVVLLVLVFAVRGFNRGLLVGVFSLVGVIGGAYLGARAALSLLEGGALVTYGPLVVMVAVLFCALFGEVIARAVAARLQLVIVRTPLETLDRLGGTLLGAAVGLLLIWMMGIFATQVPLPPAAQDSVDRSRIFMELEERLPSEALLQAFSYFDPLPEIEGPRPDVPEPNPALLDNPAVESSTSSVLRIVSMSEREGRTGSGWVAAPDLVVTNAHVVADADYTAVQRGGLDGQWEAEVMVFDERNDIAVLRVEDLGLAALPLSEPTPGEEVAVLGYPQNGPFEARAGRIGDTRTVLTGDVLGRGAVERRVTSIRSVVQPGNSGGPAVNSGGEVVATIFAVQVGANDVAYGIPSAVVQSAITEARAGGAQGALQRQSYSLNHDTTNPVQVVSQPQQQCLHPLRLEAPARRSCRKLALCGRKHAL